MKKIVRQVSYVTLGVIVGTLLGIYLWPLLFHKKAQVEIERTEPLISLDSVPSRVRNTIENIERFVVISKELDAEILSGSAVISGSVAFTARHILLGPLLVGIDQDSLQLIFLNQNSHDTIEVNSMGGMFADDVALLILPKEKARDKICFSERGEIGDTVYYVGYPRIRNGELTIVQGIISAVSSQAIIGTGSIASGMSGGGMIDQNGCILGILVYRNPTTAVHYRRFQIWAERIIR